MYVHPPVNHVPQHVQEAGLVAIVIVDRIGYQRPNDALIAHTRIRHAIIGMVMELKGVKR
jgi:hypothetical protein